MDEDTQQPAPSGPLDYDDQGYASDPDPATGGVFSDMRRQTRAERKLSNRDTTLETPNATVTGSRVKFPTGGRITRGGPLAKDQIPTSVDSDSPTAKKYVRQAKRDSIPNFRNPR